MMKQNNQKSKADSWTKLNCITSAVTTLAANTYFFTSLFNLVANSSDETEINWWGVSSAFVLAAIITVGDTYTEWVLNIQHQKEQEFQEEQGPQEDISLLAATINGESVSKVPLSILQYFTLGCNLIANAINVAALLQMITELAVEKISGAPLGREVDTAATAFYSLFGALGNMATLRTSKANLQKMNIEHEMNSTKIRVQA